MLGPLLNVKLRLVLEEAYSSSWFSSRSSFTIASCGTWDPRGTLHKLIEDLHIGMNDSIYYFFTFKVAEADTVKCAYKSVYFTNIH